MPAPRNARILVVDDEAVYADLVRRMLAEDGHTVDGATSGEQALELAARTAYDLVLCDMRLPGMHGRAIYEALCKLSARYAERVVFCTGDVLGPGTQTFLETARVPRLAKPFQRGELLDLVRERLRSAAGDPLEVLVVDDDSKICRILEIMIAAVPGRSIRCRTARSGDEAMELFSDRPADLVVSDLCMPGMDGNELRRLVRQSAPACRFVLMTAHQNRKVVDRALEDGADDYLEKPFGLGQLGAIFDRVLGPCSTATEES